MKIAVLSDIHSNVFALEAVIENILTQNVDCVVNLGDILFGPIAPRATFELLNKHDFTTICGNQDRQIYEATESDIETNPTMQFILSDLSFEPIDWMRGLPFDKQLNNDVYLCHGTPTDDLVYLLEDVSLGYPKLRSDTDVISLLNGHKSKLVCCGHTHIPRTVKLSTGQLIINPGSVGLPAYTDDEPISHSMENYCSHASYSIIENNGYGWINQQMKIPYDVQLAVNECKKRDRDDWSHFLLTGRKM